LNTGIKNVVHKKWGNRSRWEPHCRYPFAVDIAFRTIKSVWIACGALKDISPCQIITVERRYLEKALSDTHSGKVVYAVLSFGGFLGMGQKLFAVPWGMAPRFIWIPLEMMQQIPRSRGLHPSANRAGDNP
jgi:hypothetical protein